MHCSVYVPLNFILDLVIANFGNLSFKISIKFHIPRFGYCHLSQFGKEEMVAAYLNLV